MKKNVKFLSRINFIKQSADVNNMKKFLSLVAFGFFIGSTNTAFGYKIVDDNGKVIGEIQQDENGNLIAMSTGASASSGGHTRKGGKKRRLQDTPTDGSEGASGGSGEAASTDPYYSVQGPALKKLIANAKCPSGDLKSEVAEAMRKKKSSDDELDTKAGTLTYFIKSKIMDQALDEYIKRAQSGTLEEPISDTRINSLFTDVFGATADTKLKESLSNYFYSYFNTAKGILEKNKAEGRLTAVPNLTEFKKGIKKEIIKATKALDPSLHLLSIAMVGSWQDTCTPDATDETRVAAIEDEKKQEVAKEEKRAQAIGEQKEARKKLNEEIGAIDELSKKDGATPEELTEAKNKADAALKEHFGPDSKSPFGAKMAAKKKAQLEALSKSLGDKIKLAEDGSLPKGSAALATELLKKDPIDEEYHGDMPDASKVLSKDPKSLNSTDLADLKETTDTISAEQASNKSELAKAKKALASATPENRAEKLKDVEALETKKTQLDALMAKAVAMQKAHDLSTTREYSTNLNGANAGSLVSQSPEEISAAAALASPAEFSKRTAAFKAAATGQDKAQKKYDANPTEANKAALDKARQQRDLASADLKVAKDAKAKVKATNDYLAKAKEAETMADEVAKQPIRKSFYLNPSSEQSVLAEVKSRNDDLVDYVPEVPAVPESLSFAQGKSEADVQALSPTHPWGTDATADNNEYLRLSGTNPTFFVKTPAKDKVPSFYRVKSGKEDEVNEIGEKAKSEHNFNQFLLKYRNGETGPEIGAVIEKEKIRIKTNDYGSAEAYDLSSLSKVERVRLMIEYSKWKAKNP